jgi:hypothetical protein
VSASRIHEICEREVRDLPCFEYSTTVVVETYRVYDHERCKCTRRANGYESVVFGEELRYLAPLGPAIVTKDEEPDPHALDIRLTIGRVGLNRTNTVEKEKRIRWAQRLQRRVLR